MRVGFVWPCLGKDHACLEVPEERLARLVKV